MQFIFRENLLKNILIAVILFVLYSPIQTQLTGTKILTDNVLAALESLAMTFGI